MDDSQKITVLLVDDVTSNRNLMINTLQSLFPKQVQIDEANNGQMAIDLVAYSLKKSKNYHLIIMDFDMPLLNGEKATYTIRLLESHTHQAKKSFIITWSTVKTEPYPGADVALAKPLEPEELNHWLKELLHPLFFDSKK
jgi:CheY-like chemotaxis protein